MVDSRSFKKRNNFRKVKKTRAFREIAASYDISLCYSNY